MPPAVDPFRPMGIAWQRHCGDWPRGTDIRGPSCLLRFTSRLVRRPLVLRSRQFVAHRQHAPAQLLEWANEAQARAQHVRLLVAREVTHGGKFSKAVMAKLSERVKATKGKPCLGAGWERGLPTR